MILSNEIKILLDLGNIFISEENYEIFIGDYANKYSPYLGKSNAEGKRELLFREKKDEDQAQFDKFDILFYAFINLTKSLQLNK